MNKKNSQDFRLRISRNSFTVDFSLTSRFGILMLIALVLTLLGYENLDDVLEVIETLLKFAN